MGQFVGIRHFQLGSLLLVALLGLIVSGIDVLDLLVEVLYFGLLQVLEIVTYVLVGLLLAHRVARYFNCPIFEVVKTELNALRLQPLNLLWPVVGLRQFMDHARSVALAIELELLGNGFLGKWRRVLLHHEIHFLITYFLVL